MTAPGWAKHLAGVNPKSVTSRAALAKLPVLRKSDLVALQKESPPFGGFNVTPPGMRGRIVSVIIVLTNVLGYGLGPLVTGMISDAFGGAVNVALAIVSTYGIWSAAHFVWAARGLSRQSGTGARAV